MFTLGKDLGDFKKRVYPAIADQQFLWCVAVYICSFVFEGPVRYVLSIARLEPLLYVRDLVAIGLVTIALASFRSSRNIKPFVVLLVPLLFHLIVGLVSLPLTFQVLMGGKVFLPMLLGVAAAPFLEAHSRTILRFLAVLFVFTNVGLAVNWVVEFPWVGMSYDTGMGSVEVSRSWAYAGVRRLPGFTRVSYVASAVILVTMIPCLVLAKRWYLKCLILAVAVIGNLLTTTKVAIATIGIFVVMEALLWLFGSWAWVASFGLVVIAMFALPVVSIQMDIGHPEFSSWQESFLMRIQDMWPEAMALFADPLELVWGRGMGGIGVGQSFGEPSSINTADNAMVYAFVSGGVLGLIYLSAATIAIGRHTLNSRWDVANALIRGLACVWFSMGITTNMFEETGLNVALGFMLGRVLFAGQPSHAHLAPLITHPTPSEA